MALLSFFSFLSVVGSIYPDEIKNRMEETTLLSQAEAISLRYTQEIAKAPQAPSTPLSDAALMRASSWLTLHPERLSYGFGGEQSVEVMAQDSTWNLLQDIGFSGLWIEAIRQAGSFKLSPAWHRAWPQITAQAANKQMALLGTLLGNATAPGADFAQALQNNPDYTTLYHTVEIDPKDWPLLPKVPAGSYETNVPWLTLQTLHRLGYVPQDFITYVKESAWNATDPIRGIDGKVRRWIYLKEGNNHPMLAWFSPSFAAYRMAAGDALYQVKECEETILSMDKNIPHAAQEMLSLWVRKIGAYSVGATDGTIDSMLATPTDLILDSATRKALLHGLITQNAEALRVIYRMFLENQIELKRCAHVLESFDSYACDWTVFLSAPKQKFRYFEEQITGEILAKRLLKEDIAALSPFDPVAPSTWVDQCARALGVKNFEKHKETITNGHLLLAFTYAMQPGAFSISIDDLLGTLPSPLPNLGMAPQTNPQYLYDPLPLQMKNPKSFTSKLRTILQARNEINIASGELLEVAQSSNPGTLLLLCRLPKTRFLYLLAVNFSRGPVKETIQNEGISQTYAIDILPKLAEEKVFSSSEFSFTLPPLSGRAFYFQPKYYD